MVTKKLNNSLITYDDLKSHKTCIFGIQESGKTYFARNMYQHFKKPIIYMVNDDDGWIKSKKIFVWKADMNNLKDDFMKFIDNVYEWINNGKIDLVIIDEADLFFKNNFNIPPKFEDLILNHRHRPAGKGVALWFLTRRPQDIPTKIVESSKNLVVFKLEGVNAIEKFKNIHPDFPRLIGKINYEEHQYIYKKLGQKPVLCEPIK